MPGLIPLMLRPSEPPKRSSPCPSPVRTNFQPGHVRGTSSTGTLPSPRSYQARRPSQQPPINTPDIPSTTAEWKQAISEVKRAHMSRRYRACSARCAEILDNVRDTSQVEPAYLIYLHFYAAASMEMCTRPLPLTSPYRAALLQQARNHYDRARCLIQAAEDSVTAKTTRSGASALSSCRSPSSLSSFSSSVYSASLHSPSDSVNSLSSVSSGSTWTAASSSTAHSPANSLFSFDEPRTPPRRPLPQQRRVKKVSFSLPLCEKELAAEREATLTNFRFPPSASPSSQAATREPTVFIRPDSPTLGFDNFDSAADEEYFHPPLPLRDLPATPPPVPAKSSLRRSPPPPPVITTRAPPLPSSPYQEEAQSPLPTLSPLPRLHTAPSIHRYSETLSHLRAQLASHSHNLGTQLVAAAELGASRPSSPAAASPTLPPSSSYSFSALGFPTSPTSERFPAAAAAAATAPSAAEARAAEKQARIERLRKNGWVRKRFDGRRYEQLAREVLAELGEDGEE